MSFPSLSSHHIAVWLPRRRKITEQRSPRIGCHAFRLHPRGEPIQHRLGISGNSLFKLQPHRQFQSQRPLIAQRGEDISITQKPGKRVACQNGVAMRIGRQRSCDNQPFEAAHQTWITSMPHQHPASHLC